MPSEPEDPVEVVGDTGDPSDPDMPTGSGGGGGSYSAILSGVPWGPASFNIYPSPRFSLDAPGIGLQVLLFDAQGNRKALPQNARKSPSWQIDRMGGFGQGSLNAESLAYIAAGDRVDIYYDNYHQYRGYVAERSFENSEPAATGLTLYGRSTYFTDVDVVQRWNYPVPVDASVLAEAIYTAVVQGPFPWITTEFVDTGVQISGIFDYSEMSVADALNDLASQCGDRACWGFDIDANGVDRMYFRPTGDLTATDYTLVSPSANIGAATGGDSIADVKNIVDVTGGDLGDYANKILGGGFENPVPGGRGVGNLLQNASFESGSNQEGTTGSATAPDGSGGDNDVGTTGHGYTDYWHLFGGASTKELGQDNDGSEAKDGNWWIETDSTGEGFSQVFALPVESRGNEIGVDWWARPEQDGGSVTATVTLSYHNATTGVWTDDPVVVTTTPNVQAWEYNANLWAPSVLAVNADLLKITAKETTSAVEGAGIRWDAFSVWDNSKLYQSNWQAVGTGTAVVDILDEAYTASRVEGGYAVRLKVSGATDADGEDVHYEMKPNTSTDSDAATLYSHLARVCPVLGGQTMRFSAYVKEGPDATAGQVGHLEIYWYQSDKATFAGTEITGGGLELPVGYRQILVIDTSAHPAADWIWPNLVRTAPQNAAWAFVYWNCRSAGDWILDALSFRDARAPWGPTLSYQPDGQFVTTFRAESMFSGTSPDPVEAAAHASESNPAIGPRRARLSADILNTNDILDISELYFQAETLAYNYFRSAALPAFRLSVPVEGRADRVYWPGSSLRLTGTTGDAMRPYAPLAPGLPISSVRGSTDANGVLQRTIDLGSPVVTQESLIMQTAVSIANSAVAPIRGANTSK